MSKIIHSDDFVVIILISLIIIRIWKKEKKEKRKEKKFIAWFVRKQQGAKELIFSFPLKVSGSTPS